MLKLLVPIVSLLRSPVAVVTVGLVLAAGCSKDTGDGTPASAAAATTKGDAAPGAPRPDQSRDAGAEGGKICGAGGGGFLLLIVKPENQASVRRALSSLMEMPIRPEVHGSRVIVGSAQ